MDNFYRLTALEVQGDDISEITPALFSEGNIIFEIETLGRGLRINLRILYKYSSPKESFSLEKCLLNFTTWSHDFLSTHDMEVLRAAFGTEPNQAVCDENLFKYFLVELRASKLYTASHLILLMAHISEFSLFPHHSISILQHCARLSFDTR